ncbi:Unknown protein [Striga hermonthica]|uniref:Uncharacterized protein n=1 Tax=Striga hermonthica TaxID=68872 RepID=A0A9N7MUY0_STRHE|nr:Unknown protein [Striga hermonthica]
MLDKRCEVCGEEEKDLAHILFHCLRARRALKDDKEVQSWSKSLPLAEHEREALLQPVRTSTKGLPLITLKVVNSRASSPRTVAGRSSSSSLKGTYSSMNKGGVGLGVGAGGGSGLTAAAAAAAAQKQKTLLQRVDTDIGNLVDNFGYIVNVTRVC